MTRKPTYKMFEDAARMAHELNYANRGDSYASPEEMEFHRAEPLCNWDMIKHVVLKLPRFKGWEIVYGGKIRRDPFA